MKTKSISYATLSFIFFAFYTTAQTSTERYQTDVIVDQSKTKVIQLSLFKYNLKSIIRATKENNGDDDATGITGTIAFPPHTIIDSVIIKQPSNYGNLNVGYTLGDGLLEFISGHLISNDSTQLRDSIVIDITFTVDQGVDKFQIFLSAFPLRPADLLPSNNFWISDIIKTCRITLTSLNYPKNGNMNLKNLLATIAEMKNISCDPLFKGIDIQKYKFKLVYKSKLINKSKIMDIKDGSSNFDLPKDLDLTQDTYFIIDKK